jgi:hypothetical protein
MTVTRLAVAIGAIAVGFSTALAQSEQPASWQRNAYRVESLTVMIDRGPGAACSGAGIIAGHDATRVYVVTADHVIAGGGASSFGVTARLTAQRVPTLENPAEERRFAARVTQRDEQHDLALLEITDKAFANDVRLNAWLNSLGDSSAVRATDTAVIIGCGSGFGWDSPAESVPVLAPDTGPEIFFGGGYVRKGFSGGPLVKVSNGFPQIVGMTLGVGQGQRGRASRIDTVLARAREWKVPVRLSAGMNDPSCTYSLSSKDVVIPPGSDGRAKISVQTGEECPWAASSPPVRHVAQLNVAVPDDSSNRWGVHFGPFDVVVTRASSTSCAQRQYLIAIAGQVVRVTDGACPP